MKQRSFPLVNKGMNRDLSISKAGQTSAYENYNIRISQSDGDTMLSVTNERGTKLINLGAQIIGKLIGWNVLKNHIILFTHEGPNPVGDFILPEITDEGGDPSTTIYVEDISLNKTQIELLHVADTETLIATVTPSNATNSTVEWSSSNLSVATVANGVVTAVAAGTCTITARAGGKRAVCTVVVRAERIAATGITLDPSTRQSLLLGMYSNIEFTATTAPSGCTDVVSWSCTNDQLISITVDQADPFRKTAVVRGKRTGTCEIIATAGDYSARCEIIVTAGDDITPIPDGNSDPDGSSIPDTHDSGASSSTGDEPVPTTGWFQLLVFPTWRANNTEMDVEVVAVNHYGISKTISDIYLDLREVDNESVPPATGQSIPAFGKSVGSIQLDANSSNSDEPKVVTLTGITRNPDKVYFVKAYNSILPNEPYTQVEEIADTPEDVPVVSLMSLVEVPERIDRIYRIDYVDDEFVMVRGTYDPADSAGNNVRYEKNVPLFAGDLNFSTENPIESVVYFETDDIQKIYWVDGRNVLRSMNFMEKGYVDGSSKFKIRWDGDNTFFDSNRPAKFRAEAIVTKDDAGNTRANGVVQYFLTYFNKFGQETGIVWSSDLIYLTPSNRGGAADGTNNNKVILTFKENTLDTSFTHFRIYSLFRSSYDGETSAFLVREQETTDKTITITDDGAHLVAEDVMRFLYLGSQPVVAGTLAHKDQTLFIGDLKKIGKQFYDELRACIQANMFVSGSTWESSAIEFVYSNDSSTGTNNKPEVADIPYVSKVGNYPYESQLELSSSQIMTFKAGEKYRFALKFRLHDGTETEAFWIGDKINGPSLSDPTLNPKYPITDVVNNVIKRVCVRCILPSALVTLLKSKKGYFASVQLMIAEATDADRSVKAQGVVNPTMFNVFERYSNRIYAMPSWIARPRNSSISNLHFYPVANADSPDGEIQCNFWESGRMPTPYIRYKYDNTNPNDVQEKFLYAAEGSSAYTHIFILYGVRNRYNSINTAWLIPPLIPISYTCSLAIVKCTVVASNNDSALSDIVNLDFTKLTDAPFTKNKNWKGRYSYTSNDEYGNLRYTIEVIIPDTVTGKGVILDHGKARANLYNNVVKCLRDEYGIEPKHIVSPGVFYSQSGNWCAQAREAYDGTLWFHSESPSTEGNIDFMTVMNLLKGNDFTSGTPRWRTATSQANGIAQSGSDLYADSVRHIMFVDENVVTLDSPDLVYGKSKFGKGALNFRIVGVAKMSSVISDYIIRAEAGDTPGMQYDTLGFSGDTVGRKDKISGVTAWPMFREYAIDATKDGINVPIKQRTVAEYDLKDTRIVHYWMYMWHHSGIVSGFSKETEEKRYRQAELKEKIFANLHFSYNTMYLSSAHDMDTESIILSTEFGDDFNAVTIKGEEKYYTNNVQLMLSTPGSFKYPLLYSAVQMPNTAEDIDSDSMFLYSDAPVLLEYRSGTHAVISFPTTFSGSTNKFTQKILPHFFDYVNDTTKYDYSANISKDITNKISGALVPWYDFSLSASYPYKDFEWDSTKLPMSWNHANAGSLINTDQYLFIAEVYQNFEQGDDDTRYGGNTPSAIANNRFIPAGPQYRVANMVTGNAYAIFGNQGDTYFQRWDCLKTKPFSSSAVNKVIDIVSVMLETHINLDGKTSIRGLKEIASIDTAQYDDINFVYSQPNNVFVSHDEDSQDVDSYRNAITWTLPKSDEATTDDWTHVTLGASLKLDADKGFCRALRRYGNSLIAFQDRGIAEVLFNSRTQLTTEEGVPIEIGNSGKVDGSRYVSNKFGCVNKWSVVEGKQALYFVDNINKAFCAVNTSQVGRVSVNDISTSLGFDTWFKQVNSMKSWTPENFENFVAYYDKLRSDVYLVRNSNVDGGYAPSLVFNEILGVFTSFYDYGSVPMMVNVEDRFVSFFGENLWLQNEGLYCNFFGSQKDFSVQYRVTPDPYADKIWTNIEYRADFYRVLNENGDAIVNLERDITDNIGVYEPKKTFNFMQFWNEYQRTRDEGDSAYNLVPEKRFRIWRLAIPRAIPDGKNQYGLDRIRNPWINIKLKKYTSGEGEGQTLMQLHDVVVDYFE